MNSPSSAAAPDADSPHCFRAESEAARVHQSLRLRSPSLTASQPQSARISASSSPSSPSLLHRSSSLAKSPALPRIRQLMDDVPPPPQDEVPSAVVQLVAPHEEPLYNTEVRSCGHPQRLYVKVPVHLSSDHTISGPGGGSSEAIERGHHDKSAPVRLAALPYAEGTEAANPQRYPAGSPVHALAPPIPSVSRTTVDAAPPPASVSPYAEQRARLSVGPALLADEGRTVASAASASLARAATAEISDTEGPGSAEKGRRHSHRPQPRPPQGSDGIGMGRQSSPLPTGVQQPPTSPIAFTHAASSARSSSQQHPILRGTEVRSTGADVLADDVTESAPMPSAAASGEGKQLTEENDVAPSAAGTGSDSRQVAHSQPRESHRTAETAYGGMYAEAGPAAIPSEQDGVSLPAMVLWESSEAATAAEGEVLLPLEPLETTMTEEASVSSTQSVSGKRWRTERSDVDFSSAAAAALESVLLEHWTEAKPVVPAPWQLAENSAYIVQHSQPGLIGDAHASSTQTVSAAPASAGCEELMGHDLGEEAGGDDDGDHRKGCSGTRIVPDGEAAARLCEASGHPSAAAGAGQGEKVCSPLQLMDSGKERRPMSPVDSGRLHAAASLPCELSAAEDSDNGDDDATATALRPQQQRRGKCEDTAVAEAHIAARDEVSGIVEECTEDGVGKTAAASVASPVNVTAGARAAFSLVSFSSLLPPSFHAEGVSPERAVTPAAVSHSPVELLEGAVEQAPSALAAPEPSAPRGGSAGDDDGGAATAADAVTKVTRTRQLIGESDVSDPHSPCAIESAATHGDGVSKEGTQTGQRTAPIPRAGDAKVPAEGVVARSSLSDRVRVTSPAQRTVPPAPPAAAIDGRNSGRIFWSELSHMNSMSAREKPRQRRRASDDDTAHGAARARDAPSLITAPPPLPSAARTTDMWRWPPQPSPDGQSWHHHYQLRDSEQQQSGAAAALSQRLPVARDLSVDVDDAVDEEDGAEEQDTARPPRSLVRCEGRDNGFAPKHAFSSITAPPLGSPAVDAVDALVLAHRRIIADAPLSELVELEREGRRIVMHEMLEDREAVLRQEAAEFSVLSLLPSRALTVEAAAATGRWKGTGTGSSSAASDRVAESLPAWVPPLPPSPLSPTASALMSNSAAASMRSIATAPSPRNRQEVERLLRTRGLSGSLSLGSVSAALLADELLWREMLENAEAGARAMLQRLRQCGVDALNPCSLLMQEALARQRLMAAEILERQRARSMEGSCVADVSKLLEIGRELALCRVMEDDERRERIEKAEHLGRQRLRELHWRGLAARLRQRELLQATIDVALRDAIDDVLFDETQAREELRIEAIREMTKLLESVSGTVVRGAAVRHRRPLPKGGATPQRSHEAMHMAAVSVAPSQLSVVNIKSDSTATTDHEVAGAMECHAMVGEGLHNGNDWELVEEVVSDFDTSGDDAFAGAAVPPTKLTAAQPLVSASSADSSTNGTVPLPLPISAALPKRQLATAADPGVMASEGATLAGDGAPEFFEWDPTSNSASSPSTKSKARKSHPSSPAKQHTSTSSPSPHFTNMTALTATTGDTTSAITTTASSEQAVGGGSGGSASQWKQKVLATNASGHTTSDSRRSPTTVLQREEEQQQQPLKGHERVNAAEVSALLHALRCAEAAVRSKRQALRRTEAAAEEGSASPAWLKDHDNSAAVPAENLDGVAAQSRCTPPLPPPCKQQNRVDGIADVVEAPHEQHATSHSQHASTTRAPLFMNRHTIPCSLSSSPRRGYAALVQKYTLQRESPSPPPLLADAASTASSPSTSSSSSPRPYTDGDVYVYDPQRTRHSRPARRAAFEAHAGGRAPWERSCDEIGYEEAVSSVESALDFRISSGIDAPRSACKPTRHTPAREVFPTRRRHTLSGAAPSRVPLVATMPIVPLSTAAPHVRQPLVLEVITDRRSTRSSPTADVTVSPMSSSTRPSQSPTRAHPPQGYRAPTAAWAQYVQEQQLLRCARVRGAADVSGRECALYASPTATNRNSGVASRVNLDQSGCSRRRWRYADDNTLPDASAPPAPLLITRLPLECGPGVWMSSPRDAHSCVHVVATTASPHTRPAPATLTDAFSKAARRGEVVYLPTTVAELLRVPQHTHLPRPAPAASVSPTRRLACALADDRRALRQRHAPHNYADVFYKGREQTLRRNAGALLPSNSASVQLPSTPSTAFISTRCAAVREREIQRELRRSLQPSSPSQVRRAPLPSSARGSCAGSSACAASSRRASSTSSASAPITASATATGAEEEVLTEESAELAECYFHDDTAFVLRSATIASRARRHRAVEQRRQQRHQPRCEAFGAPAQSRKSPPVAPPRQQRRRSAADAANGARGGDGYRVTPPIYGALSAPFTSHSSPRAWSLFSPASPAPASSWGPSSRGMPLSGRGSDGSAIRSSVVCIRRHSGRVPAPLPDSPLAMSPPVHRH
ncbi:hypothetical protein LSCM4_08284 [Leishmania orientalis]|uniref:Uncharacterized protein n=1 Tax=Leishmania orientalis TaxID=2249476 RepID=A0A836KUW7_9TRYP|nr:hypothetical protein LSCM4_08284 [Leishmania orientalis]